MFVVTEEDAAAIRAVFEQRGIRGVRSSCGSASLASPSGTLGGTCLRASWRQQLGDRQALVVITAMDQPASTDLDGRCRRGAR